VPAESNPSPRSTIQLLTSYLRRTLGDAVPGTVRRTARLGRNVHTTYRVLSGAPAVEVVQTTNRAWVIRVTLPSPETWTQRILDAGMADHNRKRKNARPAPGVVLDYLKTPTGRRLWILERPHPCRNVWTIHVTDS
jgi:hypothetical protein